MIAAPSPSPGFGGAGLRVTESRARNAGKMTITKDFTIHIDGAARGNPGPAAFAYVISHNGDPVLEGKGYLGETTNNVAEYTALIRSLEKAAELGADALEVRSDSQLLVRQMNGEYKVKNENLVPLHREAERLARRFRSVNIEHVYREENKEADRLCNEALSEAARGRGSPPSAKPRSSKPQAATRGWKETLADAESILNDAARTWIKTGRKAPTPGEVVQQVVKLLQDRGFVRRPAEGSA